MNRIHWISIGILILVGIVIYLDLREMNKDFDRARPTIEAEAYQKAIRNSAEPSPNPLKEETPRQSKH